MVLAGWFLLWVAVLAPGDAMPPYRLPDQHGVEHAFKPGTAWVIFSFDKASGQVVRRWLDDKPNGYMDQHGLVFIAEISNMPERIKTRSAMPRMQRYRFQVLIADDPHWRTLLPVDKGQVTLIQLAADGTIEAIHLVDDAADIHRLVVGDA